MLLGHPVHTSLSSLQHHHTRLCFARHLAHSCAAATNTSQYAVIGGGIAGLATTWHLLHQLKAGSLLHLYEAHDLGAGGSGAAAGLLHPYTPKGKGREAMSEALRLVDAAEAAAAYVRLSDMQPRGGDMTYVPPPMCQAVQHDRLPATQAALVWRTGIARVATTPQQRTALDAAAATHASLSPLTTAALQAAVPGAVPGALLTGVHTAALLLGDAVVLQPQRYMRYDSVFDSYCDDDVCLRVFIIHSHSALWMASQQLAASRGIDLQLVRAHVASLAAMQASPWHAIVIAAGAAVTAIPELENVLPLELCRGVTLHMTPAAGEGCTHTAGYPEGAPSLLSQPYLAAHGPRQVVVGATKQYGTSAAAAWEACAAGVLTSSRPEVQEAAGMLLGPATELWGPLSDWQVDHARLGVRALPPRTAEGALPLAGRVPGTDNVWVVAGLGARGLVYHAWLGKLVAEGVVQGTDEGFPQQLRRWQ